MRNIDRCVCVCVLDAGGHLKVMCGMGMFGKHECWTTYRIWYLHGLDFDGASLYAFLLCSRANQFVPHVNRNAGRRSDPNESPRNTKVNMFGYNNSHDEDSILSVILFCFALRRCYALLWAKCRHEKENQNKGVVKEKAANQTKTWTTTIFHTEILIWPARWGLDCLLHVDYLGQ